MSEELARVITFVDEDEEGEMVLLSVAADGKCKCLYNSTQDGIAVRVTRRRERVRPVNDAARRMLGELLS